MGISSFRFLTFLLLFENTFSLLCLHLNGWHRIGTNKVFVKRENFQFRYKTSFFSFFLVADKCLLIWFYWFWISIYFFLEHVHTWYIRRFKEYKKSKLWKRNKYLICHCIAKFFSITFCANIAQHENVKKQSWRFHLKMEFISRTQWRVLVAT